MNDRMGASQAEYQTIPPERRGLFQRLMAHGEDRTNARRIVRMVNDRRASR